MVLPLMNPYLLLQLLFEVAFTVVCMSSGLYCVPVNGLSSEYYVNGGLARVWRNGDERIAAAHIAMNLPAELSAPIPITLRGAPTLGALFDPFKAMGFKCDLVTGSILKIMRSLEFVRVL